MNSRNMSEKSDECLAANAKWIHENSAKVRIKQIKGHTDSITNCQLIDGDRKIFTISNDKTARIWDFESGQELKVFANLHTSVISKGQVNEENTK